MTTNLNLKNLEIYQLQSISPFGACCTAYTGSANIKTEVFTILANTIFIPDQNLSHKKHIFYTKTYEIMYFTSFILLFDGWFKSLFFII